MPAKGKHLLTDVDRCAKAFKLPLSFPSEFPVNTLPTMRTLTYLKAQHPTRLEDCTHHLFTSYFVNQEDVKDAAVIASALKKSGFSEAEARRILEVEINAQAIKDTLKQVVEKSVADGAFGGNPPTN